MKRLLFVLVVLLAALAAPALAATEDEPRFEVYTPEPQLEPGASQALTVELVNDAAGPEETVPTATTVRVAPAENVSQFEVRSGSTSLGRLADGDLRTVGLQLDVPANLTGGTYRIPLNVTYEYEGDERDWTIVRPEVTVPHRPIFRVQSVESEVSLEETGETRITLRNVGSREGRETSLIVASPNPDVTIGGSQQTTVHVGDWETGTEHTVTVQPTATASANARSYPLEVRPTYRDQNGIERQAPTRFAGLEVVPAQSFSVGDVSLDLSGAWAVVSATITNEGPGPVSDGLARLESPVPTIQVQEATSPVGTLHPNESAAVSYTLRVDSDASAGSHQLETSVRYDRAGRTYQTDPTPFVVEVPTERDLFDVSSVNASFEPDASNTLIVELTNQDDEPLQDLRARLAVQPPYESQRPTAYVAALDPGETATLTFEVTTPEDAVPGSDSLAMNVTGETGADRSFRDGPYVVPFSIPAEARTDGELLWFGIGIVVVAVVLVAGWWWLRH